MKRPLLLYIALVLLPAAILGAYAFRFAEQEHQVALQAQHVRVGAEARALARRIEAAIADADRRSGRAERAGETQFRDPSGFAFQGRWHGSSLGEILRSVETRVESDEERRLLELSIRGGESFEHELKDPERAMDAYAFYLPRIHDEAAICILQWRIARAANAAGKRELARHLLEQIVADSQSDTDGEGNIPIFYLAADMLGAFSSETEPRMRALARFRLWTTGANLTDAVYRWALDRFCPDDAELTAIRAKREALSAAVASHPEILRERDAMLTPTHLLLAWPYRIEGVDVDRCIVIEPVAMPPLEAGGLLARIEYPGSTLVPESSKGFTIQESVPIRLGSDGPEIAWLRVADPQFEETMRATSARTQSQQLLVVGLLAATLAGGAALVWALGRERALARLRAQLIANVSHELRTPITSIRMFSELLADAPTDGERSRRFGGLLKTESVRLSNLIENLLDFSRLGRKEVALPREPVELSALARSTAEGFALRAREEGVALEARIPEGSLTHSTNADAVERIALNLLDNALKYRTKREPWIRLSLEETATEARLSVSDNGIGIPAGERERVFEEFYRVRYEDYAVQGSGLGLSISRRLARKLGGDILLASEPGKGSTFTLVLPRSTETVA